MTPPQLILCIPGPWRERAQLSAALLDSRDGYAMIGHLLAHLPSGFKCEFDFCEQDSRMQGAFEASAPHWRDTLEIAKICQHESVVYLVGEGGSRAAAEDMMRAAAALVRAGGLGVKVESAGLAHSPQAWLEFVANIPFFSAHKALVIYVTGEDVYSCGMHNLGLPEAIVTPSGDLPFADLLQEFTQYQFRESPVLLDGQTFSVAKDAPVYRIRTDVGVEYEEGSLYGNPYGCWRLVPVRSTVLS